MAGVGARPRRDRPARGRFGGLGRLARHRLVIPMLRSRHGPEYTARGVGLGVFWALTPTLGIQTVAILATWAIARRVFRWDSSLVQTLAWTWINNPVTMLPLYYLFYATGHLLLGHGASLPGYDAFVDVWHGSAASAPSFTERTVAAAALLGWPTLVGCIPYAIPGGLAAHAWALRFLKRRAAARAARQQGHGVS